MKRVCAWCDKEMGESKMAPVNPVDDKTHGICEACAFHMEASSKGMKLSEYLEKFPSPIIIINADGRVNNLNKIARNQLGKENTNVEGMLAGELIECVNSSLPEGCGNTEHCNDCQIRKVILDTLNHDTRYTNELVIVHQKVGGGKKKLEISITSEKRDGVVYLKINTL